MNAPSRTGTPSTATSSTATSSTGTPSTAAPRDERRSPLIDLASGQIVEPLPDAAREAVRRATEAAEVTAYAAAPGSAELRSAVAEHYSRRTGTTADPDHVTVTAGARHGLFTALAAVAHRREVLVPAPHWSHYPSVVERAGARAVVVAGDPERGFLVDPDRLDAAHTPRTAAVLVNSPVNPTGAWYDAGRMRALRAWAVDRDVTLLVDDIYWAYGSEPDTAVRPGPHEIVVGGVSKVYALAGLRIGWVWAEPDVTAAVRGAVEYTTGPVSAVSQVAAAAVLRQENAGGGTGTAVAGGAVARRAAELAGQRARAVEAFASVPHLRPVVPAGGIYLCLDASDALAKRLLGAGDDQELCRALRREAGVGLRAGSTFGMPGHLRLCVAETHDVLLSAARRLTACLAAAAGSPTHH